MKNECVCYYLDLFRVTCSEHSFSGNVDLERLNLACVTEADLLKAANRASTSGHRWPPAQAGRGAMTPIACRPLRCHAGRSKSTRVTPARPCCSAGFFDRSTAIEGRSDSFPVSEIDQSFHLKRGPTERPSAANDDLRCTKGFSSSSETTAPIERPSRSWRALTSLKMASSISNAVCMMPVWTSDVIQQPQNAALSGPSPSRSSCRLVLPGNCGLDERSVDG